jgi:hypothetical protein
VTFIVRLSDQAERPAESSSVYSEAERQAVLEQLERIVSNHNFKNSKRCVSLLRHLIERTLDHQLECMKERILGVEVFGRSVDYDTSSDPIVRTTAIEIRKRLAQYYQESPYSKELKIELLAGSYIPQFAFPGEAQERIGVSYHSVPGETLNEGERFRIEEPKLSHTVLLERASGKLRRTANWMIFTGIAAGGILAVATGLLLFREGPSSSLDRFWGPVFRSPDRVLICVGAKTLPVAPFEQYKKEVEQLIEGQAEPPQRPQSGYRPILALSDVTTTAMLTGFLSKHNVRYAVQDASVLTLADLRGGPLILVGALNNPWTLRLTSRLRFHPQLDPASNDMWIEDSQHPERHDWKVLWGEAYVNSDVDYAVVSRVQDSTTGRVMIEIGGLGLHGTQTAGEFITNPAYLSLLSHDISNVQENVQIVLKTTVINGETGPPQVLAVYYW